MNIKEELARLERMTTGELAGRYVEVCGEPARTRDPTTSGLWAR